VRSALRTAAAVAVRNTSDPGGSPVLSGVDSSSSLIAAVHWSARFSISSRSFSHDRETSSSNCRNPGWPRRGSRGKYVPT